MWQLFVLLAGAFAQGAVPVEPREVPAAGPPAQVQLPGPMPIIRVPILKVQPQLNFADTTLTPTNVREFFTQRFKFPDNDPSWPCVTPANLPRTTPPATQEVFTIGYRHAYDSGTKPFPCTTRLTEVGRGGIRFDLTTVFNHLAWLNNPGSKVEKARLQFKRELIDGRDCADHLVTSGDPWPSPSQPEWLGGKPWIDQILIPKDDGPDCGGFGNICDIDIAPIVQEWVRGSRPNNGLIFVGENEDVGARGNGACRVKYTNFALQLRISYPVRR